MFYHDGILNQEHGSDRDNALYNFGRADMEGNISPLKYRL